MTVIPTLLDEHEARPDDSARSRRQVFAGAGALCLVAGLSACGGGSEGDATPAPTAGSTPSGATDGGTGGTEVIALADVPVGGAASAELAGEAILVAQPKAGQVVAFAAACPHQGATVAPGDGVFECPLHQSTFDQTTGERLSGPATTGLREIEVVLDGDSVITA